MSFLHHGKTKEQIFYEVYDQRKQTTDPTVVLIHGAGGHYLHWPPHLRRLQQARVYAIDLPGHGRSAPLSMSNTRHDTKSSTTIRDYSTVIKLLLDEIANSEESKRVILIGHSMGGAIALDFALRWPEQLTGLVLVSTGAQLPVNARLLHGLDADFAGMTAKLVDWMYAPGLSAKERQRAVEELQKNSPDQLIDDFLTCNQFDVRAQLATLLLPTLILCGTLDKMTPVAYSEELAQSIPQNTLHLLPEAGHMAMLEAPDQVTELIQKFVAH